ncbi:MAG TPA: biotin--[acetyl-CoA-carboxylase] ligase [Firmicutes bacterium]|nr:biotin--[acetyl-CoA-carboxylase] ligase [Bacillota bacterium]
MIGRIIHLDEVDSTNLFARKLAERGEPEGTCVVAKRQTAGRGRMKRVWFSPEGGLWFSVILRPCVEARYTGQIGLIGALAVARVVRKIAGIDARVKWPNDVVVKGRKLCGVLAEARITGDRIEYVILGVGLNLYIGRDELPEELRDRATSVSIESQESQVLAGESAGEKENGSQETRTAPGSERSRGEMPPDVVLEHIMDEFDMLYGRYLAGGFDCILAELEPLCCTLGSYVTVVNGNERVRGVARALNPDGSLVVATGEAFVAVPAGEVTG